MGATASPELRGREITYCEVGVPDRGPSCVPRASDVLWRSPRPRLCGGPAPACHLTPTLGHPAKQLSTLSMAVKFREDGRAEGSFQESEPEDTWNSSSSDPGVDLGLGEAATEGNSG